MSSDRPGDQVDDIHLQRDGKVEMAVNDELVYPDFQLEKNPASSVKLENPGYSTVELDIPVRGESQSVCYPEMDFRSLSSLTDTRYLTHAIHKHPAVFIPQIPNYIINQFTGALNEDEKRPLILDPFSGSGTSGIEAKVSGRDYLGIEINPLSKLVSEVATSPIPPSLLEATVQQIVEKLEATEERVYGDFVADFPGRTDIEHWFHERAVRDLSRIKKTIEGYITTSNEPLACLTARERRIIDDLEISEQELSARVDRWLVLMIANTVFDVSNADPKVSKAHKSSTMREKLDNNEHPPDDIIAVYTDHLKSSREKLLDLWDAIYQTREYEGNEVSTLDEVLLQRNNRHKADVDIRLGDARTFDVRAEKRPADLAITSPPYINAINYYRGTKLRLFWISDLLEDRFDSKKLRRSIVGTNSSMIGERESELPATVQEIWRGGKDEFEATCLPDLDDDINAIHEGSLSEAKRRAYTTWRFFAEDMLQSIARTYEHLKPGAYFFLFIGENTIGGRRIRSHEYVSDIAENLGKFDTDQSGGDFDREDGFRVIGTAIDEISTRDLFEERNHRSGVIEHEWVVMLQKPVNSN